MSDHNAESAGALTKLLVYVVGAALGLAAKLAHMRRRKNITWFDALGESAIAAAAAFFVWSLFHYYYKNDGMAIIAAVLAGRFGDDVLITAYDKVSKWLESRGEK